MGNIRRDLQNKQNKKEKPATKPATKPAHEPIEPEEKKQKINNQRFSKKTHQINTSFNANTFYSLNLLADRLSMERCDIIRRAVDEYLLQGSIQQALGNEGLWETKKGRGKPKLALRTRSMSVFLNIHTIEILDRIAEEKGISRSNIAKKAIETIKKVNKPINRSKTNRNFKMVSFNIDQIQRQLLTELAKKNKVSRSCMMREMIEALLINTDNGNTLNGITFRIDD